MLQYQYLQIHYLKVKHQQNFGRRYDKCKTSVLTQSDAVKKKGSSKINECYFNTPHRVVMLQCLLVALCPPPAFHSFFLNRFSLSRLLALSQFSHSLSLLQRWNTMIYNSLKVSPER